MTTRVLVFAPHFEPGYRAGGTLRSLVSIVDTAPDAFEALVITSDRDLHDHQPYEIASQSPVSRGRHRVLYGRNSTLATTFQWLQQIRTFRPDVVYINSLWNPRFSLVPLMVLLMFPWLAQRILVAPRGQLHPDAASLSKRRKNVVTLLWRHAVGRLPIVWHATDSLEADLINQHFPGNCPVITSMDPTDLPDEATPTDAPSHGPLQIVFVGRIAAIKNISTMVSGVRQSGREVTVTLAGTPEDADELARLREGESVAGSRASINFVGALSHDEILTLLSRSHVMFFPTLGENFGHVIAEALSRACPVVCGPVTPFTPVLQEGGGEIIHHLSIDAWAEATSRWDDMTAQERRRRSAAAAREYEFWARSRDKSHIFSELQRVN